MKKKRISDASGFIVNGRINGNWKLALVIIGKKEIYVPLDALHFFLKLLFFKKIIKYKINYFL